MKKVLSIILSVVMLLGTLSTLSAMPVFAETSGELTGVALRDTIWGIDFAVTDDGWNGSKATEPAVADPNAEKGTQDNPYLIASAENLEWLRRQQPASDSVTTPNTEIFFDGVYFKQTADINLNGKTMNPIGYYINQGNDGSVRTNAFGGHYNGNGYKIYNGVIGTGNKGHDTNQNWAHGLFGIIYGATISNITLDGVFVQGYNITGAIVGRAVATEDGTIKNVIENCIVKNSIVDVNYPGRNDATSEQSYGYKYACYTAGAIVGWTQGTTVSNCYTDNVGLYVPVNYAHNGGIVGLAGFGTKVQNCVSNTDITVQYGNTGNVYSADKKPVRETAWDEKAIGGIVGSIATASGGGQKHTSAGVEVTNCINNGGARIITKDITQWKESDGLVAVSTSTYWGGIVGGAYMLNQIDTDTNTKHYTITNCYNTYEMTATKLCQGKKDNLVRIAGILGHLWLDATNKKSDTMYITDCLSVDVGEVAYWNCNEYETGWGDRRTDLGLPGVIPGGVNAWRASDNTQFTGLPVQNTGKTYASRGFEEYIYVWSESTSSYVLSETTFAAFLATVNPDYTEYVTAKAAATTAHSATQLANAPEGSGTKDDPYLIDSYEDLVWISEGVKNGWDNLEYGPWATEGVSVSFDGVYFEQTQNIVLGATDVLYGIGEYYKNTAVNSDKSKTAGKEYMSAFGGTYNGNGYTISGGVLKCDDEAITSIYWAAGLFGAIYGGTVKNLTVSNVTYDFDTVLTAGGLVGMTISDTSAAGNPNFNLIENCKVTGSTLALEHGLTSGDYDFKHGGIEGGIVGYAASVTIKNCINELTVESERGINSTGGIVGQVVSAVIDRCANKGNIVIVADEGGFNYTKDYDEVGYGGIAGTIASGSLIRFGASIDTEGLLISNCYNAGNIIDKYNLQAISDSKGHKIHMGGILGGLNTPTYIASTDANPYPYLLVNCHNLVDYTAAPTEDGAYLLGDRNELRKGGIVGSAWSSSTTGIWSTLFVKDCYSVAINENHYKGTNEVRYQTGTNKDSKYPATLLGDNLLNADKTGNVGLTSTSDQSSAATKTADAIRVETAKIDAAIAQAHADGLTLRFVGKQDGNADETAGSFRFIFGVDSITQYNFVGVELYAFNANGDRSKPMVDFTTTLYSSIEADSAVVTAEDLGCTYLSTLVIKNLADGTYSVKPFTADSRAGERSYGSEIKFTVTNGVIAAAN